MSEQTTLLAEIGKLIEASELRIVAALKDKAPAPAPAPTEPPVVITGILRANGVTPPPGKTFEQCLWLNETVTLSAILNREPKVSSWAGPEGLLNTVTEPFNGKWRARALFKATTPSPSNPLVALYVCDVPGFTSMPVKFTVYDSEFSPTPKPVAVNQEVDPGQLKLAETFRRIEVWPAAWGPLGQGGRLPKLPPATTVQQAIHYARAGYSWGGTPQRNAAELALAHDEVDRIARMTEEEYGASAYAHLFPEMACYGLLTDRIPLPAKQVTTGIGDRPKWPGTEYDSIQAMLDREIGMFGTGYAGPGEG